jgi:hypothetical protein
LLDTDGTLEASDTRIGTRYVNRYSVHVDAGQRVRVDVTSPTLDTVLEVGLPNGGVLTNDDYQGDRTRSELDVVSSVAGELKIAVTSFAPGATGPYHVHAERNAEAAPPPVEIASQHHQLPTGFQSYVAGATPTAAPSAAPTVVTIHVGDRVQGALAGGDPTLPSGETADYYVFDATPGRYTVTMQSSRLDSFLIVTAPDGQTFSNDDGGGGRNASLDLDVRSAGQYRIAASSYRAGESGTYELAVTAASSAAPTPVATAAPPSAGAPAGARTEHGSLASGDQQLRSGEWFDEYDYTFPANAQVHLEATSTAFDTYLILRAPDGTQTDNDDQQPGNLNAALDFVAGQSGTYRVLVTSYAPGMSGAYDLVVTGNATATDAPSAPPSAPTPPASVATAPPSTGAPSAPSAPAAPRASGDSTRVWVVSAGITDYPDAANHLPECANDARKIVEALHNQGLSTSDTEFLLVDSAATREGIHHAITQVAGSIQPNDTFVFFWSGHGGQSTSPSHDAEPELTGHDQFIYVYDGEIIDNTMAEWMDQVHALSLFALDSCYSGGFAKDVIHRPGIVGMFSSEEDVTSAVALQFQAGGYLSHFLRMGMQGEADDDPHDGTTQVGELTHYVWDQWAQHARDVRASGGYQQLVTERGSVHTDEVFWALNGASSTHRGSGATPPSSSGGRGGRGGRRGR